MTAFNPSRREFLRKSAMAGGGLVIGITLPGCAGSDKPSGDKPFAPDAFLQITPDNKVAFYCPREEMGQGVDTGLATVVAEELDVAPQKLDVRRVGADKAYVNPEMGIQGTGGSTSVKAHYLPLRQAGANARQVILHAASRDLGVPVSGLDTEDGHVLANGKRYPYGDFAATASTLPVPKKAPLKDRADFKYIGTDFPRLDAMGKATGTAVYSMDVDVPDMHYAVIVRSPVAGGKMTSMQADAARAMPGVTDVLEISSGAAVVAGQFWQAKQAAAKLEVEWDLPALADYSSADIRRDFEAALDKGDGTSTAESGRLDDGFEAATEIIERDYWAPFLAHAPMEPMNAVVRVTGKKAEVWSGTQGPVGDQGLVARALGLDKDDVTVHGTYMGGGFGRRGTLTHVVEAAEIAGATGKPIHVVWTREDDMRHGVYRPASLMRIRAGVDEQGMITAWDAARVGGNMTPTTLSNHLPALLPGFVPQGAIDLAVDATGEVLENWIVEHSAIEGLAEDYDFPNREVLHITVDHGLPLTFWRAVGHSYTAFAKETMVDELAEKSGVDAVDLRIRNSRDNPRLANVIRIAGERMRATHTEPGRALGLAAHGSFHSYVAQVAEVSTEGGTIRVHKVTCVVDCGQVINPDIVRAQMEGSIMFGLTAALYGKLELDNGAIRESNFHDYPILRMHEAPDVEVIIVDSNEAPTGVGEPGLPPVAPAVANAVYAATGQRLQSLPLQLA